MKKYFVVTTEKWKIMESEKIGKYLDLARELTELSAKKMTMMLKVVLNKAKLDEMEINRRIVTIQTGQCYDQLEYSEKFRRPDKTQYRSDTIEKLSG